MNTTTNPLLLDSEQPPYADIRPEHVQPAIALLLADAEAALELAVGPGVPPDYDTLTRVLDVPVERLHRAWAHVSHLQNVADTPELRAAHAQSLPLLIEFGTRLGADARLYAKYKAVADGPGAARLQPAQRKALADTLRDFVLWRRRTAGRGARAVCGDTGTHRRAVTAVRRPCAGRHRRLHAARRRKPHGRRARRREAGRT